MIRTVAELDWVGKYTKNGDQRVVDSHALRMPVFQLKLARDDFKPGFARAHQFRYRNLAWCVRLFS